LPLGYVEAVTMLRIPLTDLLSTPNHDRQETQGS
jgi:hypothetical protein